VLAQAPREWLIAFVGLLVSHGYSFVSNFLLAGERERATARSLMAAPYKRIVILHVAIIAGGFAVVALGQPLLLLLVLVVGKTGLDIALHLKEHRPAPTD
jgi:ABC-type multidrug transport system permease subunit